MSGPLQLYHWEPNTYFLKPLIALEEKGARFASRWFDPTQFEQFAPGFPRNTESDLQLEREGPVLVHGDTIISSSFFMLEYIADALPGVELRPGMRSPATGLGRRRSSWVAWEQMSVCSAASGTWFPC